MDLRLKILVPILITAGIGVALWLGMVLDIDTSRTRYAVVIALLAMAVLGTVVWYAVDAVLYRPLFNLLDEYQPLNAGVDPFIQVRHSPLQRLRETLAKAGDLQQRQHFELERMGQSKLETLAALGESEERYALAVRSSNDGLWEWDVQSNAMYLSPRWKSMLGFSEDDLQNSFDAWRNCIHAEDRGTFQTALQRHLNGESPRLESEHRVMHKDGSYRWVLSRGMALRHANGSPYRMLGLDTDTSQFKQIEEVLIHVAQCTANVTGEEFFRQLVQHFALALKVRVVFVARCMDQPPTRVRAIACWDAGEFVDEEYDLEPTPCKKVIEEGKTCFIPQNLGALFPEELPYGLHSYLGIPIFDSRRAVLGHLVFKDDKQMETSILMDSVYQIFTARAGAEMERLDRQRNLLEVARGGAPTPAEERLRNIVSVLSETA